MILKHTTKIICILIYLLLNTINAKYINTDKIFIKVGDNIVLKSKIYENINIIKILTLHKNKKELKNKILAELAILNTYPEAIKKYNLNVDPSLLTSLYKETSEKHSMSLLEFKKFIEKKYKINEISLIGFIIGNLTINKIQKINLADELIISNNDINNFFIASNYIKPNKLLNDFKIIQISFSRKIKDSFKTLKNITNLLKTNKDIHTIKTLINKNINTKIIEINSNNKNYFFLKNFLEDEKYKSVSGPIYIGRHIYLYKTINKKNKSNDYKTHIKISFTTERNKKFKENKRTKNFLNSKTLIRQNVIKKLIYKSKKTYWISKDNIDPTIYEKIKNLEINQKKQNIETKTGLYNVRIIDKRFDQKSNIYSYIEDNITSDKIKLLNKKFEKKYNNNSNITYYK